MFAVFRETIGIDEDLAANYDLYDYLNSYKEAENLASKLTNFYKDEEWKGYKWYLNKFYVTEISYEQALRNKRKLEGRQILSNW